MARRRQRVRLEDGLKLDLNRLVPQELVRPGAKQIATIRWAYRYTDKEIASGRITADMTDERRGRLRLELGELDQWIELVGLARHYGGSPVHSISAHQQQENRNELISPGSKFAGAYPSGQAPPDRQPLTLEDQI
jgi:hypothetical protein